MDLNVELTKFKTMATMAFTARILKNNQNVVVAKTVKVTKGVYMSY